MQTDEIEVISEIIEVEIIAIGNSIRNLERLQKKHGRGSLEKTERLGKCSPAR
jgi:hypothetical protein